MSWNGCHGGWVIEMKRGGCSIRNINVGSRDSGASGYTELIHCNY